MTHVTCRLTAKNRDQLRNPTLGNRVWATFKKIIHANNKRQISQTDNAMTTRDTHEPDDELKVNSTRI